jgi:hypothetical protein
VLITSSCFAAMPSSAATFCSTSERPERDVDRDVHVRVPRARIDLDPLSAQPHQRAFGRCSHEQAQDAPEQGLERHLGEDPHEQLRLALRGGDGSARGRFLRRLQRVGVEPHRALVLARALLLRVRRGTEGEGTLLADERVDDRVEHHARLLHADRGADLGVRGRRPCSPRPRRSSVRGKIDSASGVGVARTMLDCIRCMIHQAVGPRSARASCAAPGPGRRSANGALARRLVLDDVDPGPMCRSSAQLGDAVAVEVDEFTYSLDVVGIFSFASPASASSLCLRSPPRTAARGLSASSASWGSCRRVRRRPPRHAHGEQIASRLRGAVRRSARRRASRASRLKMNSSGGSATRRAPGRPSACESARRRMSLVRGRRRLLLPGLHRRDRLGFVRDARSRVTDSSSWASARAASWGRP